MELPPNNSTAIQDILCEFLEIATFGTLHSRKIYPDYIFTKHKKYGVVVYDVEHPLVKDYVSNILKAVHYHSQKNQLRKFVLLITQANKVLERYIFEIIELQNQFGTDAVFIKLEQTLRTFYLKLIGSEAYLKTLPDDCEFKIQIHTTNFSNVAYNEDPNHSDFNWIQANSKQDSACNVIPVHTVDLENLILQMYIEYLA